MEVTETLQGPHFGQSFDLAVVASVPTQRFTTDCSGGRRPFAVVAECEPGEVVSLAVAGQ